MRILYCANDPVPFPKGAGRRIEATVRALHNQGANITLFTPVQNSHSERLTDVPHQTLEVGSGEDPFIDRALRFRRGVEDLLRQGSWDVFWFRSPWEGWAAQRTDFQGVRVYEAHGFPSMELPHHFPDLREQSQFLGRLAYEEQILLTSARRVLTPSQTGLRFLRTRGVAPEQVVVIPNTVPEEAFLERQYQVSQPLRLIYTGTLAPWQGLDLLLEALLHLKNKLEFRLELVGTRKGRWTRPLRALAQQMRVRSHIEFSGPFPLPELRERLLQADIAMVPLPADPRNTVQGCCPIKLVEFMAAAMPIVSTRLPVVEELVRHQESAWLVRPNSPWALAQGILHLAQDASLRQRLGEEARTQARSRFHRARFEEQLGQLLGELG